MYCKKSLQLLFLNLISFASSSQSYHKNNKFSECSSTDILCGTNFTISYPFRLKGMPDYCGNPKFEVQCTQNHILEIDIVGKLYRVSAIRYDIQFLGVKNPDYLMSKACPRTYSNTSLDLALYKYLSNAINVTLFFSCSRRPSPSLNLTHIACLSNTGDSQESYYSLPGGNDRLLVPEYAKNCKQIVLIPIYDNMVGFLENNFLEVLQRGFGLSWIVGDGWCGDCVNSGGVCGNDPKMPGEQACFCRDGSASPGACQDKKKILVGVIGVVSGLGGALLLATCIILFLCVSGKGKLEANSSNLLLRTVCSKLFFKMNPKAAQTCYNTHIFSYEELEMATQSFHESRELGHGGFGTIYKGKLQDGRTVAIKRLHQRNHRLEQFTNEVEILSRLRHQNLVTLYGCTSHHSRELLLVYEYIPNGTLADHLHGPLKSKHGLPWPNRMSIIIQTAEAISYLHSVEPPIIHRDIKTNNILVDDSFQIKVADFGISRLFPLDATHISTRPQRTFGYLDPEYCLRFQLTDKSDVYSFGVVLTELISSKRPVDIRRNSDEIGLAKMAITKIQSCRIGELVDPDLGYEDNVEAKEMIDQVAQLAYRCLQSDAEMRPGIKEVVGVLKRTKGEVDANAVGCDQVK